MEYNFSITQLRYIQCALYLAKRDDTVKKTIQPIWGVADNMISCATGNLSHTDRIHSTWSKGDNRHWIWLVACLKGDKLYLMNKCVYWKQRTF
jgi:hypothetical protein